MTLLIPVRDLDEVKEESRKVLAHRRDEIADGRIGTAHWFVAVCAEAYSLVQRRRFWEQRRDASDEVRRT